MASIDSSDARIILETSTTVNGRSFDLHSIYHQHPEEKCFRLNVKGTERPFKVRFATATSRLSVVTEHEAIRYLRERHVKWATAVREFRPESPSFLITDYLDGQSLDVSLEWVAHARVIVADIGAALDDVHSVVGNYFGHLGGPPYTSWHSFFHIRFWGYIATLHDCGIIPTIALDSIHALYEEARPGFDRICPMLLHADVKPANIIFDAHAVRAHLIDFELARFGDADFEWIKMEELAKRWPEYDEFIARPLLRQVSGRHTVESSDTSREARLLLYRLHHVCSIIAFETETRVTVPARRTAALRSILDILRSGRVAGAFRVRED